MSDGYSLSLGGLRLQWAEPSDGTVYITLDGELDNLSVAVLRQALESVYAADCYSIRLDLAGLSFIDSSGLGALVGAWRHCSQHQGTVAVVDPTTTVSQLMDMTGISRFLCPS